jgi:hypothetical protein
MRAGVTAIVVLILLAVLGVCAGAITLLLITRSGRSMPPAWIGSATVHATLSCPTPAASTDAEVLGRRMEALGLDGEPQVLDPQHLGLTLRGVRGPDVVRSLIAPRRLAMSEVLDGAVTVTPDALPPDVLRRQVGRDRDEGFFASSPRVLAPLAALAPTSSRFVIGCTSFPGEPPECEGMFVRTPEPITNADVESAEVAIDEMTGMPYVSIQLTSAGGSRFALLTRGLVQRRLAIIVDDEVMSAPVVIEEIPGGRAQITLGEQASAEETFAEASALAAWLDVGAALSCAWQIESLP